MFLERFAMICYVLLCLAIFLLWFWNVFLVFLFLLCFLMFLLCFGMFRSVVPCFAMFWYFWYVVLCFVMSLICFHMFCYVLRCFAMFCYVFLCFALYIANARISVSGAGHLKSTSTVFVHSFFVPGRISRSEKARKNIG